MLFFFLQKLCYTQLIKARKTEAEISVLSDFERIIKFLNLINYNEISQASVVDFVASVFFTGAIFSFFFAESKVSLRSPKCTLLIHAKKF